MACKGGSEEQISEASLGRNIENHLKVSWLNEMFIKKIYYVWIMPVQSSSTLQSSFLRLQRAFTPPHGRRKIKHESTTFCIFHRGFSDMPVAVFRSFSRQRITRKPLRNMQFSVSCKHRRKNHQILIWNNDKKTIYRKQWSYMQKLELELVFYKWKRKNNNFWCMGFYRNRTYGNDF